MVPRETSSREASGLSGKQNCFPRDHTLSAYCYTSQLEYVFRLVENVSRVVGQNSPNTLGRTKLTNPWETAT